MMMPIQERILLQIHLQGGRFQRGIVEAGQQTSEGLSRPFSAILSELSQHHG